MDTIPVFRWSGATGEPAFTPTHLSLHCRDCNWRGSYHFSTPERVSLGECWCGVEQVVVCPDPA